MRKDLLKKTFLLGWLLCFMFISLNPAVLFAAGHGCETHEADRDGDGVPDRSDDYPDDPTRTGKENEGDLKRGCGDQVPAMRLFFIPFGTGEGFVTAAGIESSSVTSLIACSDDGIGGAIKNILGETPSGSAAGSGTSAANTPGASAPSENLEAGTAGTENPSLENPESSSLGELNSFEDLGAPLGPGSGIFPSHDSILKTLDCATRIVNEKIVPCKEIFPNAGELGNSSTPWPPSYDQIWQDEKCGQKDAEGSLTFCVPTDKGMVIAKTDPDKVELFILQLQNLGVPLQLITGIITGNGGLSQQQGGQPGSLWEESRCGQKDEQGRVIECRAFGNHLLVLDSSSGTSQVSFVSLMTSSDINALPPEFLSSSGVSSLDSGADSQDAGKENSLGKEIFYCGQQDPWGRKIECQAESKGLKVSTVLGSNSEMLALFGFASPAAGEAAAIEKTNLPADETPHPQGENAAAAQCGVADKEGVYQKCPCPLPGQRKNLNKNQIRLKAEFPADKTTFYVDDQGVVLKTHSDKKISDLSCLTQYQMRALEKEIQKASGNTDLSGKTAPSLAS